MESDTTTSDETVVRQVLKELTENVTSPTNNSSNIINNKVGSRKSEKFDVVGGIIESGGNQSDCNTNSIVSGSSGDGKSENVDTVNALRRDSTDKQQTKILEKTTELSKLDDEISSSSDNYSSSVLPDIVNVQPNLINTATDTDDSLILALTSNLTGLRIGTPKGNQPEKKISPQSILSVPNSLANNCDALSAVSSDDEVFSECQTFNEANAMDSGDLNHSIHWENVVSSVTSGCADSIDNTLEQFEPSSTDLPSELQAQASCGGGSGDASSEALALEIVTNNSSNLNTEKSPERSDNVSNENVADTTCNANNSQESISALQTIQNEVDQNEETLDLNATTVVNSINSQISIPEIKIGHVSALQHDENMNGTFNANDISINVETTSPKQDCNVTYSETSSTSPNISVNQNSNSPAKNTTYAANNLNSTFNATSTIDCNATDDYTFNAKKEKCHENELKIATLTTPNDPEPMDIDEILPETMSPSLNSTHILSKENSPAECNPKSQDLFVENLVKDQMDVIFKPPNGPLPQNTKRKSFENKQPVVDDSEFSKNGVILNPSDFDFLLSKQYNNVDIERNSLLLRFDPLAGQPVPVNQQQQPQKQQQQQSQKQRSLPFQGNNNKSIINSTRNALHFESCLSPAFEEVDTNSSNQFLPDQVSEDSSRGSLNCTVPVGGGGSGSDESSVNPIFTLDTNNSVTEVDANVVPSSKQHNNSPPSFHENQKLLKDRLNRRQPEEKKGNAKMSVDVMQDMKIENDTKSIEHINSQLDEKHDYKMAELEKKIKNETLKNDDVEKKLKEAEQREEALLKRIAEKDRTISKMSGVLEAYEKAIAELIAEKEQITQNYEKKITEIEGDRDLNYQHLTSLEATFSDLHLKYERSKQVAATLKASEEALLSEKKQNLENLRLQEQRYDKMKSHAMQQLEIANNKLETLSKTHAVETTKLKAQLKKEEISRLSVNEQLLQKSRENEELVKICDELINGQGTS